MLKNINISLFKVRILLPVSITVRIPTEKMGDTYQSLYITDILNIYIWDPGH